MQQLHASVLLLILLSFAALPIDVRSFGVQPSRPTHQLSCRNNCMRARPLHMSLFEESISFESVEEKEPEAMKDNNGAEFAVGSVVRVVSDSLKAFQISPKGQGSFNDKKEFVPGEKYLVMPVGLRGTVTKVYNVDEISANLPIQVKFEPGKNTDEGYDPPVAFLMHFETYEIECV